MFQHHFLITPFFFFLYFLAPLPPFFIFIPLFTIPDRWLQSIREELVRVAMPSDIRVPLSCVFGASLAQRHAIPHRSLLLDASHPFIQYLESDDTRLPEHPVLTASLQPAEAYETYVGEDVWEKKRVDDGSSTDDHPMPRFDDVVQWVMDTIDDVGRGFDGVVLCGQHVVADDCGWAVPSRTPTLITPRDVFVAMRNSSKFLRDVHNQLHRGAKTTAVAAKVEISLARALGGSPAKEFRLFLPYRFSNEIDTLQLEAWDGHTYVGISQRETDICFPSLMAWDQSTHNENFSVVMHHIKHAMLLERAFDNNIGLREELIRRAVSSICGARLAVMLLAVDVLFESPSLPVHLVSAKVRCFPHDDVRDPDCIFPFVLVDDDDNAVYSGGDDDNDDTDDRSDLETVLCDSVSFFRLFRDPANWNKHVEICHQRKCAAGVGESGTYDYKIGQKFFLIASERGDLVLTREKLAKRGLPLEFICPDLVVKGGDKIQKEWRDKLMQCMSLEGQAR